MGEALCTKCAGCEMCSLWFTYSNIPSHVPHIVYTQWGGEEGCPVRPLCIIALQSTDRDREIETERLRQARGQRHWPETCKGGERLVPKEGFVHEGGLISRLPLVYTKKSSQHEILLYLVILHTVFSANGLKPTTGTHYSKLPNS